MISDFFEIFLLSIIQGIFEFLPISSQAHLIVASNIYAFKNQSLLIDISLHLGSLLAILYYFKEDIFDFNKNNNLFYKIIIGSIPLVLFGYLLYSTGIIYQLRNIKVIAWATLFFGILIYIADKNKFLKKIDIDFNFKSVLIIGFFQVLALIPGVSRSGITITAGRILGFDRIDSTKISFYLSIPALIGASLLSIKDLFKENIEFNFLVLIGIFLSFLFSLITIKFFLKFLKKFSLNVFVVYRIFLALILFYIIYY
ncbi:MAG TPA: undecaprenyl-diphosphate phosphatase [Candidatus Pelagibacter bacterium]|jgi:undecaprenyl-diphosphatase|nr:UDP-diphosphatase [Candidatus Pelagibacter sp.]HJN84683.1 undecaprenyl-diphosphate phosphatase [Candidatus Pelagibacter bacterium]|tara:strand:- start:2311 stop:3078 length:768 start_codon:yes stop_codon:yes gene_type:complete